MRPAVAVSVSLLALAAGCGEIGISLDSDSGTGSAADAAPPPAPVVDGGSSEPDAAEPEPDAGLPACRWGELSADPFAQVNGPDYEESGSLTGDGLSIFFTRFPVTGQDFTADVFEADRESVDQPFGAARPVAGGSKAEEDEFELEISGDGTEIFFLRLSDDILSARRPAPGAPFGTVATTGLLGFSPSLSGDGLALYFIDLDFTRIMRATRTAIGQPWETPVDVGGVGGFDAIDVSADQLQLLLSRPADGISQTVAIASRASLEEPFGAPISAGDVFRLEDDIASFVHASWDADRRHIVVSVELLQGDTGADLYLSTCE